MKVTQSSIQNVFFDHSAYEFLNKHIKNTQYSKVFVLVDENTHRDCLPNFSQKFEIEISGSQILKVKQGEIYKTITTCVELWNQLSKKGADRKSLLINLGGGVVTDMGGFVASTFKRGIDFINIPTTLLSMVDASVGGKTGVDLGLLKNQVGTFSDAKMVIVDSNYLNTLPQREIKSGWAEMYKHGLIADKNYWNLLKKEKAFLPNYINDHIKTSVLIKNKVVETDRFEGGLRKILNFGHTLGHAIESYRLNKDDQHLLHGEAIGIGMILEAYLSHKILNLPLEDVNEIKAVFLSIYKKEKFSKECINEIKKLLIHDKKNSFGNVQFVLLEAIGKAKIDIEVNETLIDEAFQFYKKD